MANTSLRVPPALFPVARCCLKLIKSLHHMDNFRKRPRTIEYHVRNLSNLLYPAFPSDSAVSAYIQDAAESWGTNVCKAMIDHYTLVISDSCKFVFHFNGLSVAQLESCLVAATHWAKTSLGQKLTNATITEAEHLLKKRFGNNHMNPTGTSGILRSVNFASQQNSRQQLVITVANGSGEYSPSNETSRKVPVSSTTTRRTPLYSQVAHSGNYQHDYAVNARPAPTSSVSLHSPPASSVSTSAPAVVIGGRVRTGLALLVPAANTLPADTVGTSTRVTPPVGSTRVLGSSAPGSSVPGSSAPATRVPDSSAPGSSVRGSGGPASSVRGSRVPASSVRGSGVPASSARGSRVSASSVPALLTPSFDSPPAVNTVPPFNIHLHQDIYARNQKWNLSANFASNIDTLVIGDENVSLIEVEDNVFIECFPRLRCENLLHVLEKASSFESIKHLYISLGYHESSSTFKRYHNKLCTLLVSAFPNATIYFCIMPIDKTINNTTCNNVDAISFMIINKCKSLSSMYFIKPPRSGINFDHELVWSRDSAAIIYSHWINFQKN
jgi:hypothetical protein